MKVQSHPLFCPLAVVLCCTPGLTGGAHRDAVQIPAGEVLHHATFSEGRARGWQLEPGWEIARHPSGQLCLHGRDHHVARLIEGVWADFTLSLKLNLARGEIHVNLRSDFGRGYVVVLRHDGLSLLKQVEPRANIQNLATAERSIPTDRFVNLVIVSFRDSMEMRLDGETVLLFKDREPLPPGRLAFETMEGSEAWIDNVTVFAPDRSSDLVVADLPKEESIERIAYQFVPTGAVVPPKNVVGALPATVPLTSVQKALRWKAMGGPLGGLGYDVRMRPGDPDVMYVSDALAGVFKSLDGGKIWSAANGSGSSAISVTTGWGRDAIPIFSLTVDPHNPDTIWVGTKDKLGIFKSTDGGKTWQKKVQGVVPIYTGLTFRGFTVDPRKGHSNTVYAAGELSSYAWTPSLTTLVGKNFDLTKGVVYRTVDGGNNWQEIWRGNNLARYVWIDPKKASRIYISTGIFDREAANTVVAKNDPGGVGVVKSTDGGKTWRELNQGNGLKNLYVGSLFMHPKFPNILLAGTGCNAWLDDSGVYLSEDGGESWQQTLKAQSASGESITAVEFATSAPHIAYAGGNRAIYRSEDTGHTWEQMTPGQWSWGPSGIRAGWPIDLQVDPRSPDRLFANNYGGGNYLSEDGGKTWVEASQGYTGAQMRDLAVVQSQGGPVWAAARSGLFVSSDAGMNWQGTNDAPAQFLDWQVIAIDPSDSKHVLTATSWDPKGVYQRRGGSSLWQRVNFPMAKPILYSAASQGVLMSALAFAPTKTSRVYAGTGGFTNSQQPSLELSGAGIYVSNDGGDSWNLANNTAAHVQAIAVSPKDADVVYAATSNDFGVLKSVDGGKSWHVVFRRDAMAIAIHPSNPDTVFVGLESGGIYRSTDAGSSWQSRMGGIDPSARISRIVPDPKNPDVMYAADRLSGVYFTTDGGSSWIHINQGLANREVNVLAITGDGRTLFAGTEGAGVFRLDIPASGILP